MKIGNIVEFIKKHKTAFGIAAGVTTTAVTGVVGYKLGWYKHINSMGDGFFIPNIGATEPVCNVLRNIPNESDVNVYSGFSDIAYAADELGELGKRMIEAGANNETFTHFIAIGKTMD
jgi:hypothetical protein